VTQHSTKNLRICSDGHRFYKSSDCPTCPHCEKERKPKDGFLALLYTPARRALEREGITTLRKLSQKSEKEILQLHGMGKSSLPVLRKILLSNGFSFRKH
jgi:predicted RecB family nuclease